MSFTADNDGSLDWVLDKIAAAKKSPPKKTPAPKFPDLKSFKLKTPTVSKPDKVQKAKDLASKRTDELGLWKAWVASDYAPKHLTPLMKSFTPLMQSKAQKQGKGRVEIPKAVIDAENHIQAVKAFKTYDPKKGPLSSWLMTNLQKSNRLVHKLQNTARITGALTEKIGPYKAMKQELSNKLGFEPDDHTLHEALVPQGFSMKDIKRLNKELRAGFISGLDGLDETQGVNFSNRENEVIHLILHQLTPEERAVHEYSFGLNGKPRLKPGQIAKTLKIDNSKVSKLKTSIMNKMAPHLE